MLRWGRRGLRRAWGGCAGLFVTRGGAVSHLRARERAPSQRQVVARDDGIDQPQQLRVRQQVDPKHPARAAAEVVTRFFTASRLDLGCISSRYRLDLGYHICAHLDAKRISGSVRGRSCTEAWRDCLEATLRCASAARAATRRAAEAGSDGARRMAEAGSSFWPRATCEAAVTRGGGYTRGGDTRGGGDTRCGVAAAG